MGDGKGSGSQAPVYNSNQQESSGAQEQAMMNFAGMMEGIMQQNSQMMQQQSNQNMLSSQAIQIPSLPDIQATPAIDWEEKSAQLEQKARGNFSAEVAKKKGIGNTVFTSVLDNNDDPDTTSVLI
jgi:hypothetical protein